MTRVKAIQILNGMFDSYLIMEKVCSAAIGEFDDKQLIRYRLDEITDKKIAILTAIDALEQSPDSGWISMKDRRPEPETWAMVYIKYPSPVFEFERGIRKTSNIKKMFYDGKSFYCDFGTITHWMPLPQKPESEGDAE